uniref:GPN-loop GTPase 2 n=2 Tax=Meloidogyne TaxID=189290 RepID=A0A914KNU2_MELIC
MSTEELKKLRGKCFNFESVFERCKGDSTKLNDLLELCDVDPGEFFEALEQAEKDSDSNKFYKDCLNTLQNTCINVAVSITGSYGDVIGVMCKMMLFKFAGYFQADNVFCFNTTFNFQNLFDKISTKYKTSMTFINPTEELEQFARAMDVKCNFISSIEQLNNFCTKMTATDSSPPTTSAKKRKLK